MNGFVPMDWKAQEKALIQAVKEDDSLSPEEKKAEIERIKNSQDLLKKAIKS